MNRPRFILSAAALIGLFHALPASAQFYGGFGPTRFSTRGFAPIPRSYFGGLPPIMPVRPLPAVNAFNPLMFNPLNPRYSPQLSNTVIYYGLNRAYSASSYSPYTTFTPLPSSYGPAYSAPYSTATRDYGRAQYAASAAERYYQSTKVNKPANGAKPPVDVKPDAPGGLVRALAGENETEIASGASLNTILAAATTLDRGDKVESELLTPEVLAALRFTGSPDADLVNVLQEGGRLTFPEAFDSGGLAEQKAPLEKTFAMAVAPALAGKPNDVAAAGNLEATLKNTRAILNGTIRDQDFEQATASRRFMNRLDAAVVVLKKPGVAAVVVPRWKSEGVTAAELARHMVRFKMQFAPAAPGDEAAYTAVHRALSNHLFALLERNGGAKQPK